MGWALAVFVGVIASSPMSGAHLNPAVTIAMAYAGEVSWSVLPTYIGGQMLGAMIGALLVWAMYKQHFDITEDQNMKLGVFCTGPAIRSPFWNTISEIIGTFVLVYAALSLSSPSGQIGSISSLPIAAIVAVMVLTQLPEPPAAAADEGIIAAQPFSEAALVLPTRTRLGDSQGRGQIPPRDESYRPEILKTIGPVLC